MNIPTSITEARWFKLRPPYPKPEIWDLTVGNGQHLGWDRCWAFVNTHRLDSRSLAIVWAIGYAMKDACEKVEAVRLQAAYEQGWRDACDDWYQQSQDPAHPIGARLQAPYIPQDPS